MVTDKKMPDLHIGRSKIAFCYRKDMPAVTAGIDNRKTDTGQMKTCSVGLIMLDLLRYLRAAGGIDHIATLLSDPSAKINSEKLGLLPASFEQPVVQRLGHLLVRLGHGDRTAPMFQHAQRLP